MVCPPSEETPRSLYSPALARAPSTWICLKGRRVWGGAQKEEDSKLEIWRGAHGGMVEVLGVWWVRRHGVVKVGIQELECFEGFL